DRPNRRAPPSAPRARGRPGRALARTVDRAPCPRRTRAAERRRRALSRAREWATGASLPRTDALLGRRIGRRAAISEHRGSGEEHLTFVRGARHESAMARRRRLELRLVRRLHAR